VIAEVALENWFEFWRVGIPRRLNKKWQEDFTVAGNDSSCEKYVARKRIVCPSDLLSEYVSSSAIIDCK
jgi:hypothetical protein